MAGLFGKVGRLARSPQGRRALQQATRYAKSEKGRRQLAAARERITSARTSRKQPPR